MATRVSIRKAPKKFNPFFKYEVRLNGKRVALEGTKREAERTSNKIRKFSKGVDKKFKRK